MESGSRSTCDMRTRTAFWERYEDVVVWAVNEGGSGEGAGGGYSKRGDMGSGKSGKIGTDPGRGSLLSLQRDSDQLTS